MLPLVASAQLSISGGIGYGTFRMSQLHAYSDALQAATPVATKSLGNFRPYVGYELGLTYNWANKHHLGIVGGLISTGSLTTRTDYSGSVDYKHQLSTKMLAVQYGFDIHSNTNKWNLSPSIRVGALFTKYRFDYEINLNDGGGSTKQELNFKSISSMVSPGFAFRYHLTNAITAVADLRYLFDLKANLRYDKNKKLILVDQDGMTTSADWTGIRGTLSIEFSLKGKEPE
jgi:hypothetical protein